MYFMYVVHGFLLRILLWMWDKTDKGFDFLYKIGYTIYYVVFNFSNPCLQARKYEYKGIIYRKSKILGIFKYNIEMLD